MEHDQTSKTSPKTLSCSEICTNSEDIHPKGPMDETALCPLCKSAVRPFFINLNEKLSMCENDQCEFPFGHQDVQLFKHIDELNNDDEVLSITSPTSVTGTMSITSRAWSDIYKINRACDSEDSQCDIRSLNSRDSYPSKELTELLLQRQAEQTIQNNIDNLKKINDAMQELSPNHHSIRKEDWLNNLQSLQKISGQQLLRNDEMIKLKKKEPEIGLGELQIDITPLPDSTSTIHIEIKTLTAGSESGT